MKSILLIDNSKPFVKYLELVITRIGYQALSAHTAESGLKVLRKRKPDLVITETALPDMSGMDLCRAIKEDPKSRHIPVIMLTTDNLEKSRTTALKNGFADYFPKPISVRTLYEMLERHLNGYKGRRNLRASMVIQVQLSEGKNQTSLATHSFSEGGMFLKTAFPKRVGSMVDLTFSLPGTDSPIKVKGAVIYNFGTSAGWHPPGMGIKFINLGRMTRRVFSNFMEECFQAYNPSRTGENQMEELAHGRAISFEAATSGFSRATIPNPHQTDRKQTFPSMMK